MSLTYVRKASISWVGPAVLLLLSGLLFGLSTRWGIGIRPDSIFYLGLPGMVHPNAPAYAWLLNIVAQIGAPFGLSKLGGATVTNYVLLLSNLGLTWWIIIRGTGRPWLAFLGGLLCLSAPMFLDLHVTVMSEGLFIFCILLCLVWLARYVETGKFGFAAAAGFAAGLATLARFNGVPLIVLGPLSIAFLTSMPPRIRARDGAVFLLASVGMLVVWMLVQQSSGGPGLGREVALNGNMTAAVLNQGVSSLLSYLMPLGVVDPGLRPLLLAACVLVWLVTLALYLRRWSERRRTSAESAPFESLPIVASVFVLGHVLFLVLSLFIEATLPLKPSYMLPVYVVSVIAAILLVAGGAAVQLSKRAQLAFVGLALALSALNLVRTGVLISEFRKDGIFYASPGWRNSPTVEKVAATKPELEIYSNGADVLSFLLPGRSINWVPAKFNRRTGRDWANNPFENRLNDLRRKLAAGQAVVVILDRIEWRFYMPTERNLIEALNLVPLSREADGTIYGLKEASEVDLTAHKISEGNHI